MSYLSRIRNKVLSFNLNKEIDEIRREYYFRLEKKKYPVLVISCLDSRTSSAGFADRLRGMISCYAYAKAVGVPFRIEHTVPFNLSDYLIPNHYDWLLDKKEKTFNLLYANPVFFILNSIGHRSTRLFRISPRRQHHLYTNANYINEINQYYHKQYHFSELYHELFKPSAILRDTILSHKNQISSNGGYISVSFRFMQLMGDFKDIYGDVLPEKERLCLLNNSLAILQSLYNKEKKRILVTSDSQSFIQEASKMSFVYVVPGKIGHIGFSKKDDDIYEKMFLDFLLISQADHVYMAYSGKMYRSNFAKTAALSSGAPYSEITY